MPGNLVIISPSAFFSNGAIEIKGSLPIAFMTAFKIDFEIAKGIILIVATNCPSAVIS